jgi:hypothetical protein
MNGLLETEGKIGDLLKILVIFYNIQICMVTQFSFESLHYTCNFDEFDMFDENRTPKLHEDYEKSET